jgi:hypothetical protein
LIPNVYNGLDFLKKQPFADALFGIAILILIVKAIEVHRMRVKRRAAQAEILANVNDPALRIQAIRRQRLQDSAYPLLQLITTVALIAVGAYWTWYSIVRYDLATGLFATVAGIMVLVPMACLLPFDIRNYWSYRQTKSAAPDMPSIERIPVQRGDEPTGEPPATQTISPEPVPSTSIATWRGFGLDAPSDVAVDVHTSALTVAAEQERHPTPDPAATVVQRSWGPRGQYRREVTAIGWLAGLIVGCYVFGFVWAIPLFMFAYGMTSCSDFLRTRRARLTFSILSAAALWLVTWLVIDAVLHLPFTPLVPL